MNKFLSISCAAALALTLSACGGGNEQGGEAGKSLTEKAVETTKAAAGQATEAAKEAAGKATEAAKEAAGKAMEAGKEAASSAAEAAKGAAAGAMEKAKSAATGGGDAGAKLYSRCAACHGGDGKQSPPGTQGITIAGQSADDIAKKLKGYKDGSFGGTMKAVMAGQVASLSDADIQALADYISKF